MVWQQKVAYEREVVQAMKTGGPLPPTAVLEATKNAMLLVKFSKQMIFPDDMQARIMSTLKADDNLLNIRLMPMESEDRDDVDAPGLSRLISWSVIAVEARQIAIKLDF